PNSTSEGLRLGFCEQLLGLSVASPSPSPGLRLPAWHDSAAFAGRNRERLAGVQGGGNEPPGRRTDAAKSSAGTPTQPPPPLLDFPAHWRAATPSALRSTHSPCSLPSRLMSR